MARKSLVLVLGAGASCEANLPLGDGLKKNIRDSLKFEQDKWREVEGDRRVFSALAAHAQSESPSDPGRVLSQLLKACGEIRGAMPQTTSIDAYVESRKDNPHVVSCAKIAIATCILRAEAQSILALPPGSAQLNYDSIETTWFAELFKLLFPGHKIEDAKSRAGSVGIVSFNYDRTIEQYLALAVANFYSVSPAIANAIVAQIEVYHPYGVVGSLFHGGKGDPVPFGAEVEGDALMAAARRIKTYGEGVDPEGDIDKIRGLLAGARKLVFLGFAFHEQNMKLLFPDGSKPDAVPEEILATAYCVSEYDRSRIKEELKRTLGTPDSEVRVEPFECRRLIRDFSRVVFLR